MEIISLKMDGKMLKDIDANLGKYHYSTRTEFIRDAIRHKLTDLEKQEAIARVSKGLGMFRGKKIRDEEEVREEVAREHLKKFNLE